jgi:hypothetical protein
MLVLKSPCVWSQGDTVKTLPGIEITTSVDSATVYVGDLITYTISITYDSTYELVPPPLGANLGAFDVKDYQSDIQTKLEDGRVKSETFFKLSTFTTGDYVIPPVPVAFILKDGTHKVLLAEPVPITVQSLLQNTDDSTDIRPLKPQYEFERRYLQYIIWGACIVILLAASLAIWMWLRRRRNLAQMADRRPPWEIAFAELAKLEQKGLFEDGKFKEYYFELTDIARHYLGRMFSVDLLEMTTEELLDHFRGVELPSGLFDDYASFLRHADLVKFAKLIPTTDRCRVDFKTVHGLIEQVRLFMDQKRAAEVAAAHTPPTPVETSGGARG